jgi:large subunit ribosomal protein L5
MAAKETAKKPKGGGDTPKQERKKAEGLKFRDDLAQGYKPRLLAHYRTAVVPQLREQFGYANVMQVPRLEKIVLNMGLGEAVRDSRLVDIAVTDLQIIAGQKPVVTKARKSIAGFKIREGMPIGAKVTLRGSRMWEFGDRLLSIALPRIRDFRGLSPDAFDAQGNFTVGVTEQLIFPEIEYDKVERQLGMDITFVTTASSPDEGYALLKALGLPLRERNPKGQAGQAAAS